MTTKNASQSFGRRTFLARAAAAASLAQRRNPPVNLIYVFADQLRRFSCGYAGDEFARTPNIDRLARESLDVRNAAPSTPVCAPYRASLLTGKYQSSTGMVINELRLSPEHECFGHVLTRNGYDTASIGHAGPAGIRSPWLSANRVHMPCGSRAGACSGSKGRRDRYG